MEDMKVNDNSLRIKELNNRSLAYEIKKNKLSALLRSQKQANGSKIILKKSTSNLFRLNTAAQGDRNIDVRSFNNVINIDPANLVARVEGMTTYETLVDAALKYSCLPIVVPELKSITIGGALAGCGIESSSFLYGLVHETIKQTEILLGDGQVIQCSPNNAYSDLFYAFPNTFGTLGYALEVEVALTRAMPYVKLEHHRFNNCKSYFEALDKMCREHRRLKSADFIDGVIFGKNEMYITVGRFVDEAPYVSNYRYMNIYYKSIAQRQEDFLTTHDYIWRWDPDWFWCSKVFYLQNPIIRFLLGKVMLRSSVYSKIMHFLNRHYWTWNVINAFNNKRESIIQDIAIPIDRAPDFFDFMMNTIGITPLWVCPAKAYDGGERFDFCPLDPETLYVDFGFWDAVATDKPEGYYNRKIEEETKLLQGFKSLYSTSYYNEEEFWQLYDHSKYQSIKNKYDPAGTLRDLYVKCTTR